MDKCSKHCHCNVQDMSYQGNQYEWNPSETSVSECHLRKGVECKAKHAAGKAQRIQTQIAEYIAKKSSRCVVGLPKSASDVDQRVLVKVPEREDSDCGNDSQ